ncbi:hypothetical protein ACFYTQ_26100 [Nocardia sp. NPDC004068]|uniref:hypothetical protein n=1 Tax=Nocardia sp. NPDC004068 TaxID=3364303 RepID=UPI003691811C
MKEAALVRLTQTLSNTPQPLARLIAKLGKWPVDAAGTPRKKLVHKLAPPRAERRSYKPNRKLLPDEVEALVAKYQAGASIADLAREFGMHTQTVDAHLKRQGVEKRGSYKLSPDQADKAVRLYADGWSTIEIAKEFSISTTAARLTLIRAGVTLRSSRQGRRRTTRNRKKK